MALRVIIYLLILGLAFLDFVPMAQWPWAFLWIFVPAVVLETLGALFVRYQEERDRG